MAERGMDKFANTLYDTVTESSANALTFKEITIGLTIFDKVALLIARFEYTAEESQLTAVGDIIEFGLSASNSWSDPDPSEGSIIDYNSFNVKDYGTAGVNRIVVDPYVKDLSTLPGGGLLVSPKPLYLFVKGASLPNPGTVKLRLFFTIVKMKDAEYFELLEARNFFG